MIPETDPSIEKRDEFLWVSFNKSTNQPAHDKILVYSQSRDSLHTSLLILSIYLFTLYLQKMINLTNDTACCMYGRFDL